MKPKTIIKTFPELSGQELYAILRLRSEVFVIEQDCVYQDLDNQDQKALHLYMLLNDQVIAYARIFKPGLYFEDASIGRVLVKENHRKLKVGHLVIEACIKAIQENYQTSKITISAQSYLKKFYISHNFIQIGEGYLEDNIPHIKMTYKV